MFSGLEWTCGISADVGGEDARSCESKGGCESRKATELALYRYFRAKVFASESRINTFGFN